MKITIEESGNTLTLDMPNANMTRLGNRLVELLPSIAEGIKRGAEKCAVMSAVVDGAPPISALHKRKWKCSVSEGRSSCEIEAVDDFDAAALAAAKILPNQRAPWRVLDIKENEERPDTFDFLCESGDRLRIAVNVEEVA